MDLIKIVAGFGILAVIVAVCVWMVADIFLEWLEGGDDEE